LIGSGITTVLLFRAISGVVSWPYLAGTAILAVGVACAPWKQLSGEIGLDRLVPLGALFFAVPMAVFSGDHFVAARAVRTIVPSWMHWHLFWTYFVGTALMAAALSIAARKESQLAAAMMGFMLLLFVPMIHIPSCFAKPFDKTRVTMVMRDSSLSAGALCLAAVQAREWRRGGYHGWGLALESAAWEKIASIARFVIGIEMIYFGVQHLLSPSFAPGFPQEGPGAIVTMPSWIPAHPFWGYLTGALMIAFGMALLTNWKPRTSANLLGTMTLILIALVYIPLTLQNASNIALGLNYLAIHFALAGELFLLAAALPKEMAEEVAVATQTAGVGDFSER
jgi:uncharacterized membrane protein